MSHRQNIKRALDDMGKDQDAEFFGIAQDLFMSYQQQFPGQEIGFFKYVLGGLTVVYDASMVNSSIRWELKTGKSSQLFNVAKSGFVTPLAPLVLDEEIAKHAPNIASDCGLEGIGVLKYYLQKVRPHLRLADPKDSKIMMKVQASIRDPKDVHYLALHFERNTAGVATFDKDIMEYPEKVSCFNIKDFGEINVSFRKHYVVMMINVFSIYGLCAATASVIKFLWKHKKRILYTLLTMGTILFILRIVKRDWYNKLREGFFEALGIGKDLAKKLWVIALPFMVEYLKECKARMASFQTKMRPFFKRGKKGKAFDNDVPIENTLTYARLVKMIFLSQGNLPLSVNDLCTAFQELGFKVGKVGRSTIRTVVEDPSTYVKFRDKTYLLADESNKLTLAASTL